MQPWKNLRQTTRNYELCIACGSVPHKAKIAKPLYPVSFIYKMELLREVCDLEQVGSLWLKETMKELQGHQLGSKSCL